MKLLTLTSFLSLNLITGVNYCYSEMESNASKKVKRPSLVKRMPPKPSFIPKLPKRMPKPFKTSVRWSDFKYNSPEEKEFWDSVPDWTSELGTIWNENFAGLIESKTHQFRKNSVGKKIAMDSALGYNGFAKRISVGGGLIHPNQRIIYEVKNGWIVRFRSWNIDGHKISEGSYKEGKRDGIFLHWETLFNHSIVIGKSELNYKDGIIHGPQTTWYPNNGSKEKTKTYKLGSLDGPWIHWFKNGQKSSERNYKDGKIDGLRTSWYENGQKSYDTNYKDGKIDGLSTSWYENGQKRYVKFYEASNRINSRLIRADAWTSNGKKCMITNVREGNGVFVYYSSSDEKRSHENYQNGYLHGKIIKWNWQGQIISARDYKDGNRSGLSTEWYENGYKKEEGNYTNKGRKNGLWSYWNEDGKMKEQLEFQSSGGISKTITFDGDGKKLSEIIHEMPPVPKPIPKILSPKVIKPKPVTPVEKNISSRTVTRPKIRPLKISTTETSSKIDLNSQKIIEAKKKKLTEKREKWIVDEKKRRVGEFLDQSQEGFTNGYVTSFSHLKNKNWSSFKAGKKGVLSTIELAWSNLPRESDFSGLYGSSMKGFIMEEDDENGTIVANWSISKDDLMLQFAGLKRAEQNWVIINVISNSQLQLGKTYYIVCENISEEKEWFGNFSFSDKNPYQDGRFWYNQNHDLMFRTYVKPAK